jgi:molybdopterin converting factor small subunit
VVKNNTDTQISTTAIRFFGPLEELIGFSESRLDIGFPQSGASLRKTIDEEFPALKGKLFLLAIDEELVEEGVVIDGAREISCLPPFAGG